MYSYLGSGWVNGREFAEEQFLWAHAPARLVQAFEEPITQLCAMIALRDAAAWAT